MRICMIGYTKCKNNIESGRRAALITVSFSILFLYLSVKNKFVFFSSPLCTGWESTKTDCIQGGSNLMPHAVTFILTLIEQFWYYFIHVFNFYSSSQLSQISLFDPDSYRPISVGKFSRFESRTKRFFVRHDFNITFSDSIKPHLCEDTFCFSKMCKP